jgi:3-hydroxyacyl-[acyl-carrier-protein] dehydratase
MLEGDFFHSRDVTVDGHSLSGTVVFNPEHRIFAGHFPGQPVVPGVCMLQILKEYLEKMLAAKLILQKASQVKYLALIDPVQVPEVQVEISFKDEKGVVAASARLYKEPMTFLKFRGEFAKR